MAIDNSKAKVRRSRLEPTNVQRAEWAKNALAVFTAETYSGDQPDSMHAGDLETAIGDLICDLLHYARYHPRLDTTDIHAKARETFENELAEEGLCDCSDRSWYGPHHDSQCPVSLAASATQKQIAGDDAGTTPGMFDVLLDIKRQAEKSGDMEAADPYALLDLIADMARNAIAGAKGGAK